MTSVVTSNELKMVHINHSEVATKDLLLLMDRESNKKKKTKRILKQKKLSGITHLHT